LRRRRDDTLSLTTKGFKSTALNRRRVSSEITRTLNTVENKALFVSFTSETSNSGFAIEAKRSARAAFTLFTPALERILPRNVAIVNRNLDELKPVTVDRRDGFQFAESLVVDTVQVDSDVAIIIRENLLSCDVLHSGLSFERILHFAIVPADGISTQKLAVRLRSSSANSVTLDILAHRNTISTVKSLTVILVADNGTLRFVARSVAGSYRFDTLNSTDRRIAHDITLDFRPLPRKKNKSLRRVGAHVVIISMARAGLTRLFTMTNTDRAALSFRDNLIKLRARKIRASGRKADSSVVRKARSFIANTFTTTPVFSGDVGNKSGPVRTDSLVTAPTRGRDLIAVTRTDKSQNTFTDIVVVNKSGFTVTFTFIALTSDLTLTRTARNGRFNPLKSSSTHDSLIFTGFIRTGQTTFLVVIVDNLLDFASIPILADVEDIVVNFHEDSIPDTFAPPITGVTLARVFNPNLAVITRLFGTAMIAVVSTCICKAN
jgi:hypothetical protein